MTDLRTEKLHARLRVRGITPTNDPKFWKMASWTRLTFALCTAAAGIATAFACMTMLGTMAVIAIAGAAMPRHPFDYIYNTVIRRITGTIELPTNGAPTRFACGIAAAWFVAMAVLFQFGFDGAAYVLGVLFVAVGALVSITHFCIPGTVYQFLFGDRSLILPSITGRVRT